MKSWGLSCVCFFVECLPDGCSMKPIIVLDHLCNCEKLYFHLYLYIDWCLMQDGEGNHVVPLPTRSYVYWINFSAMHFLTGTQSNQSFSSIPNTFWIVLFNMMSYIVCCRFLHFFNDAVEVLGGYRVPSMGTLGVPSTWLPTVEQGRVTQNAGPCQTLMLT